MSEKLHQINNPEGSREPEKCHEHHKENKNEKKIEQAVHEAQNKKKENLEVIRQQIQERAQNSEKVKFPEELEKSHSPTHQPFANKELKEMAYKRTLNRVRQQMGLSDRLMSHIIHQPAVNAISETVSKTIGRPSGILGGGFLSLVGTSAYYYVTKHYGYDYNHLIFLLLLGGGFIVGWLVEALWYLFGSRKKTF